MYLNKVETKIIHNELFKFICSYYYFAVFQLFRKVIELLANGSQFNVAAM